MQTADIRELFDYMYWLNHQILDTTGRLDPAVFWTVDVAAGGATTDGATTDGATTDGATTDGPTTAHAPVPATPPITTRSLRGTLVHELDVEWSWRLRLQGRPTGDWGEEAELRPEHFPTFAALRERWTQDEAEMRAWIATLSDQDLAAPPPAAASVTPRPLWQYLIHVLTHAIQQQSDAATLLSAAGRSPGEMEFLDYARAAGK